MGEVGREGAFDPPIPTVGQSECHPTSHCQLRAPRSGQADLEPVERASDGSRATKLSLLGQPSTLNRDSCSQRQNWRAFMEMCGDTFDTMNGEGLQPLGLRVLGC